MEYLDKVLGVKVTYDDVEFKHLPNFIATRYRLQMVSMNEQKMIFLYPKTELEQIEDRLDQIYHLKRKYGNSIAEILEYLQSSRQQLQEITFSEEKAAQLQEEYLRLKPQVQAAADLLTSQRHKTAKEFLSRVKKELEFLNMPSVRLSVSAGRSGWKPDGQDELEFLLSSNVGEEPKPLAKIASGGELSRIMLAFKSALADRDALPTVIYDEIDTGVSGLAAGRIGQLLHQTAKGHQVLCITHTPQVAAFADNQLLIQKNVRNDRTFTEIHTLDMDGRVEVLARMISGDKVSELSLASARELIEKSK